MALLTRRAVLLAKLEQTTESLQAGSTDTIVVLAAAASAVTNYYVGMEIKILNEVRTIIAYNGSSKNATLQLALAAGAPAGGTAYAINTYGIDASPLAANVILGTVPTVRSTGKELKREYARDTLSTLSVKLGDKEVEITFDTELKGSGSKGTAPEIGPLLRACGFLESVSAGSQVEYWPRSEFLESVTIYVYKDAILHKVVGCVGEPKFDMTAGEYGKISWTFRGKYASPVSASMPTTSPNATAPPIVRNANLVVTTGTYTPIATKVTFEMNNNIGKRVDMNQPDAVRGFFITGRDPGGQVDPEVPTLGERDFWNYWENSTLSDITVMASSAEGNVVTFTASGAVFNAPAYEDREGIMSYGLPFKLSGDDSELRIVFK